MAQKLPVGRDLFFFNYPLGKWGLPRSLDQTRQGGRQRGLGEESRELETQRDNGCSVGRGRGSWGGGGIQKKMRRWVLAIAILSAASAAALFLGAEAQAVQQQGHQTERISGER